jgi:hypothetical protein
VTEHRTDSMGHMNSSLVPSRTALPPAPFSPPAQNAASAPPVMPPAPAPHWQQQHWQQPPPGPAPTAPAHAPAWQQGGEEPLPATVPPRMWLYGDAIALGGAGGMPRHPSTTTQLLNSQEAALLRARAGGGQPQRGLTSDALMELLVDEVVGQVGRLSAPACLHPYPTLLPGVGSLRLPVCALPGYPGLQLPRLALTIQACSLTGLSRLAAAQLLWLWGTASCTVGHFLLRCRCWVVPPPPASSSRAQGMHGQLLLQ